MTATNGQRISVCHHTLADVAAAYSIAAGARREPQDASQMSLHASLHDPLTGLPNRALFVERLRHAPFHSGRTGRITAVLFIDLDDFDTVNEGHGHQVGDELLVAVAQRLSRVLRPRDTLGRLSVDEFVVLCEDLDSTGQAHAIGDRLVTAFLMPFRLSSGELTLTASIGICVSHHHGRTPQELMHDANAAMHDAKRRGSATHQVHRSTALQQGKAVTGLEIDLAAALQGGELYPVYQPIVATMDGRITGFEALLRWAHPIRGVIPPEVSSHWQNSSGRSSISGNGFWVGPAVISGDGGSFSLHWI